MTKNILYLGSQSKARQKLLDLAKISYQIIEHSSDECGIDTTGSFNEYVLAIARHKMKSITLPSPETTQSKTIFVLTADTLMRTEKTKQILGKPTDKNHAKQMLALLCLERAELVTGCCLDQKNYIDTKWVTSKTNHWTTPATLSFCVATDMVDRYFEEMPHAMNACGAGIIEDFGLNFLKDAHGSFTAIFGLPLFELRTALHAIGFFEQTS
ncbi:Maf family protein [Candidatus Dependentiae bacterium]|nr:Maf family protein [Candidatus Dependentiae bacterium]